MGARAFRLTGGRAQALRDARNEIPEHSKRAAEELGCPDLFTPMPWLQQERLYFTDRRLKSENFFELGLDDLLPFPTHQPQPGMQAGFFEAVEVIALAGRSARRTHLRC